MNQEQNETAGGTAEMEAERQKIVSFIEDAKEEIERLSAEIERLTPFDHDVKVYRRIKRLNTAREIMQEYVILLKTELQGHE